MRQRRLKLPAERGIGCYHCISRIVDRRMVMGHAEKKQFLLLVREFEAFCEVRVLTYCLMSNHFHLLVEVAPPPPKERRPTMDQMLEKLAQLSGYQRMGALRTRVEELRSRQDAAGEAQLLTRYHSRLWDVSAFMKLVKQRFTQWFNRRHGRQGTLWEDRFRSVLVEAGGASVAGMGIYIDLNPVRAGLVDDPGDYRWSGYGEAMAGQQVAMRGIQRLAQALSGGTELTQDKALERYRMGLFRFGHESNEAIDASGETLRGALKHARVMEVLKAKGRVGMSEYTRCRVRYFCDGAVFGGKAFVEEVFQTFRDRFGPRRRSGARRMRGVTEKLYVLRDLQLRLFG